MAIIYSLPWSTNELSQLALPNPAFRGRCSLRQSFTPVPTDPAARKGPTYFLFSFLFLFFQIRWPGRFLAGGVASQDPAAQKASIKEFLSNSTAPWHLAIGHHPVRSYGAHCETVSALPVAELCVVCGLEETVSTLLLICVSGICKRLQVLCC